VASICIKTPINNFCVLSQECRNFPNIWELPQNSRRQNNYMKQGPYWETANAESHRKKLSRHGDLASGKCAPHVNTSSAWHCVILNYRFLSNCSWIFVLLTLSYRLQLHSLSYVEHVWNVMAHAQKPNFIFQRNWRVHLKWRGGGVNSVDYWQPRGAHQQ